VTQVRGYADQFLRVKNNPYDPSNRRITILVKNQEGGAPPQLAHAQVVDGGSGTIPPAAPSAAPLPNPEKPQSQPTAPTRPSAATPRANPTAASPLAKTSLFSKLISMIPGKKK
jgi:chemotaxis protein MotB